MKQILRVLLVLTAFAASVRAQSIQIDSVTSPSRCDTAYVTVYYTASGYTDSKNVFTVQLSTAAGSFGSFSNVGSLKSTGSGSIPISIPTGDHYRVRIASSTPYSVSGDNGSDIAVAKSPKADFWVNDSVRTMPQQNIKAVGDTLVFHANRWWAQSLTYSWDFGADATPATSTDPVVPVVFSTPGTKSVTLHASNGECEAVNVGTSSALIEPCSVSVPADAIIDSTTFNSSQLEYTAQNKTFWVVPGGVLHLNSATPKAITLILVEPGGTVIDDGYNSITMYLKPGASYQAQGISNNIVIHAPGSSIPEMMYALGRVECNDMSFDYTQAPPYKISWLDVKLDRPEVPTLAVTPVPATTSITVTAPDAPQSVTLRDARGAEVFRYEGALPTLNVTVDVSQYPAGTYFILLRTRSGVSVGKFTIQR